jgi:hypothetical protein
MYCYHFPTNNKMKLVLIIALLAALITSTKALVALQRYNTSSCDKTPYDTKVFYKTGVCSKNGNSYFMIFCTREGEVKYYSGYDSTCPEYQTQTYQENICSYGQKFSCDYTFPSDGIVSTLYNNYDCSDTPLLAYFYPSGCHSTSGPWFLSHFVDHKTDKNLLCRDSQCSRQCEPASAVNKCTPFLDLPFYQKSTWHTKERRTAPSLKAYIKK